MKIDKDDGIWYLIEGSNCGPEFNVILLQELIINFNVSIKKYG